MATSDLLNELKKDAFRADAELERKLSMVILNQLEDASGDISNLAVSWWVPSTHTLADAHCIQPVLCPSQHSDMDDYFISLCLYRPHAGLPHSTSYPAQ